MALLTRPPARSQVWPDEEEWRALEAGGMAPDYSWQRREPPADVRTSRGEREIRAEPLVPDPMDPMSLIYGAGATSAVTQGMDDLARWLGPLLMKNAQSLTALVREGMDALRWGMRRPGTASPQSATVTPSGRIEVPPDLLGDPESHRIAESMNRILDTLTRTANRLEPRSGIQVPEGPGVTIPRRLPMQETAQTPREFDIADLLDQLRRLREEDWVQYPDELWRALQYLLQHQRQ